MLLALLGHFLAKVFAAIITLAILFYGFLFAISWIFPGLAL